MRYRSSVSMHIVTVLFIALIVFMIGIIEEYSLLFKVFFLLFNFIYVSAMNYIIARKSDKYIKQNFRSVYDECYKQIYGKNPVTNLFSGTYPPFVAMYLLLTRQEVNGLKSLKREALHFIVFVILSVFNCLFVFLM